MNLPAMQKETTTTRPARVKPSQSIKATLIGLAQESQQSITIANTSNVSEVRTGARTGLAQVVGIRNSMSQSIIELGQLIRILSQM